MTTFVSANFDEFDREIKRMSEKIIPEKFDAFKKKIAIELFRRIVLKTPVGNPTLWKYPAPPGYVGGRARGNWQMKPGSTPDGNETGNIDPSGAQTITTGTTAILSRPSKNPYESIVLFNNVPYIERLENGYSKQAPAGMIDLSLAEINLFFASQTL